MFSTKQLQILAFAKLDYDMLICDGAIRSGKTSVMTVAFIDWAMQSFNGCNLAICGKTVGSAIKNIVKPYMALSYAREKYSIRFNRAENLLTVRKNDKCNLFYIYGGKDESSYMLIQGITLAGVLLDEAALMVRSFVEQAMARCSVEGSRFWVNCNPETPSHWFYRRYICKASDEYREMMQSDALKIMHLHFLMEDNPSLSDRMIARYKAQYTGIFYQKYIEGKWVRAEGIVFRDFSENTQNYIVKKSDIPSKIDVLDIGFDIGGNGSAYAITATGQTSDKTLYVLGSRKKQAKDLPMNEVSDFAFDFINKIEREYKRSVDCVSCDHSDVIINTLNEKRYIFGKTYKPPLEDRPFLFSVLMAKGKIKFAENECDDLISELCELIYDAKKEKPIVADDGSMQIDAWDSLTYSVSRTWHYLTENMR